QVADLPMLTSESILMIDNRAAMIDLDCSGIKSLWVGLIFYLLLTWIERFKVNSAWLATGLAFGLLLVFGNIFRIVILVTLELVLEFTQAARLLHQPLGLLSFALSCLVVWMVLIRFGDKTRVGTENRSQDPHQPETGRSLSCAVVIIGILLLLIFCYRPLQTAVAAPDPHLLELPPQFGLRGASLGETEKNIYQNNRARAEKYQLSIPAENGRKRVEASMVLVWSRAWKSQHVPDNCYISQGYSIIDKQLRKSDRDHIQRYLQLLPTRNSTESQRPMTAVYWFQSVSGSTPDYSARVVDGLFHPNRQWVMASILFRETVEPDGVKSMIILIRQQLAQALAKTDQPSIPARSHSNET
ncbi:MAG: archaeosortase/exosortase family protein, partial [Thermodesulfobacteriota bacterium]